MHETELKNIIEAILIAAEHPLSIDKILALLGEEAPKHNDIRQAIIELQNDCMTRGIELIEVSSGYRIQTRACYAKWVSRLWEEKSPRFSRAYLETLALVAYRQPITRAEIEEIRGVAVNSTIIKSMLDRGWVRIVGHKEVPGRPELLATTREFLDYFNLQSLEGLPSLAQIQDMETSERKLNLPVQSELFEQKTVQPEQPEPV